MSDQPELYLVGGAVRDHILFRTPSDHDYLVTKISTFSELVEFVKTSTPFESVPNSNSESGFVEHPDVLQLKARDPETNEIVDISCCRREYRYSDGAHPDRVLAGSLDQDLARRDFTINAMVQRVSDGFLYDPFNGRHDLVNNLLKTVGRPVDRFVENPNRVIRAFRFAAKYDLTIDVDIMESLNDPRVILALMHENDDRKVKALNKVFTDKFLYPKFFQNVSYVSKFFAPALIPALFSNVNLAANNKKSKQHV